jgi:hypothetical protein
MKRSEATFWAWVQLIAGSLGCVPVIGIAHAYATHEADRASVLVFIGHVLALGVLGGPLLVIVSAALTLRHTFSSRVAISVGICGSLLACGWSFLALWSFTFWYPPYWALYATTMVVAGAACTSLAAVMIQAKLSRRVSA